MKNRTAILVLFLLTNISLMAQDPPVLSSWIRNTTNYTGYNNILADVQQVRYSANYVYINSTSIPNYSIGPWPGNPNVPTNQNFLFKITRTPIENAGTKTTAGLGVIGVWINGVGIFNARDGRSYNNQNIWHQDAVTVEGPSFDGCKGHPAPGGTYHNHQDPVCLHDNAGEHSPLLGYAYDGFPVYGPYGYSNPNDTNNVRRIKTGYRFRNITTRTTLPDGTILPANQYGPPVSTSFPLGYYVEDYEYDASVGDLDKYNGRFSITPEYPGGIYAYYITVDTNNVPAYPYTIGQQYYGVVVMENITTGGHVTITEAVQVYNPISGIVSNAVPADFKLYQNYPNPFNPVTKIEYDIKKNVNVKLSVYDMTGKEVVMLVNENQSTGTYRIDFNSISPGGNYGPLSSGIYIYKITAGSFIETKKMVILK